MNKHESIIISTDHKHAMIASMVIFILLIAIKWFVIGYWFGHKQ